MAPVSWPAWPGFVKGIELSVLDLLAVALLFTLPRTSYPIPFKIPAVLYALAIVISAFHASVVEPVFFYLWQFARASLLYVVVLRGCADKRVPLHILYGMAIGVCYEVFVVLVQRFAFGMLQPPGTFGHQNFLGLITNFVIFPWFFLYLAGFRGRLGIFAVLGGACIAALTASRATIGLSGIGFALSFVISSMRFWTHHKTVIMLGGLVAAAIITPLALASLDRRYAVTPLDEQTYDERAAFERAAEMMVSDHPFGVGANSFVTIANTAGYYDRAGVAAIGLSRSGHVHNAYWLVAAETGYLGLFGFVLLLLGPLWLAFRYGWTARQDARGDLLLGFGVSFLVVYAHSFFEWVFITMPAQYVFAIAAGIVAGLANGVRLERKLGGAPKRPLRKRSPRSLALK